MSGLETTLITAAISTLGFAPLIWHKAIKPLFNKTRKLFKPKPKYEPAGTIHYGQFEITIENTHYEGIGKSNGYYDLYIDGGYHASYPQHLLMKRIIDHAKEQK